MRTGTGALPPERPRIFVEKVRGAFRLAAVDRAALALGLTPGLALADARARVPALDAVDADPAADRAWLDRLADGCVRYTPMVASAPPDALLLDITGCAHLFGGEALLAQDAMARLERLGMEARAGRAGSPDAALALARFGTAAAADKTGAGTEAETIGRLPVAALGLEPDRETALRRAGLGTIADLAARPPAMLAARFGEEACAHLARLRGAAARPIDPRRPAPMLAVERCFAEPVTQAAHALAILAELVAEAAARMAAADRGGRRFAASFFRTDGLVQPLEIETGRPTRAPDIVVRLFAERIESLADPLDPGFGYDLVRLAVPVVEPLAPLQLSFDAREADAEIAALIDRLSVRLGPAQVRRPRPRDTHVPERAAFAVPAADAPAAGAWPEPVPGEPPLRPLHLLSPPQRIEVVAEVPDGPPHLFTWRRVRHQVVRAEGPERIAPEWWRRADDGGRPRDYYRVEDDRGRRFWIFRHGLYDGAGTPPLWYLHGLFA